MASLYEEVFNGASIYDMLFFNIKAVLIHPTLDDLKKKNPVLFERWKYLSTNKYGGIAKSTDFEPDKFLENIYQEKAIYYPEYTRIVAITWGTVKSENGKLKPYIKRVAGENEYAVIATFMDILQQVTSEGMMSTPRYVYTLCGHNIINYDIPLLIKRFILHRNEFKENEKQIPFILKNCLNAKPWESTIIDTVNVWKFNGNDYTPLMLIADYLGLKKNIDLEALPELSKQYWNMVAEKPQEALDHVALQSANQTNLVIQLINELRQL